MKTRIIIPTYNEKENIAALLDELLQAMPHETRVLVVDDGSPDGTADLVQRYMARENRVELLSRSGKLGMGSAYRAAFENVLADDRDDYIVTIDADFSHNPHFVP